MSNKFVARKGIKSLGDAEILGNLGVTGNSIFNGDVNIIGDLNYEGDLGLTGNLNVFGTTGIIIVDDFYLEFSNTGLVKGPSGGPGLQYVEDYSTTFTDNSIVSKKFVEDGFVAINQQDGVILVDDIEGITYTLNRIEYSKPDLDKWLPGYKDFWAWVNDPENPYNWTNLVEAGPTAVQSYAVQWENKANELVQAQLASLGN
jgi:hypothetical protein